MERVLPSRGCSGGAASRSAHNLFRYLWALPNTLIGFLFVPFVLLTKGHVAIVDGVVELHGWLPGFVLRRCMPIRGGASAITFGHVVLGRDETCLGATRAHERVHVRQCEVWGPAFIPFYLLASLWAALRGRGAYAGNYFEREAFRLAKHVGRST